MASQINDPRWPPGSDVDFDSILSRLIELKILNFPNHTARDSADPLIQVLRLIAALGQNALQRANHALNQLDPKTATSRRALISLMEIVNRPLRPMVPSRGFVYGKLKGAPTPNTIFISKGVKFIQPNMQDPIFSADRDVSSGSSVNFLMWVYDASDDSVTSMPFGSSKTFDVGDSLIVGFDTLIFDELQVSITIDPLPNTVFVPEYYNEEWGTADTISSNSTEVHHYLDTYLNLTSMASPDHLSGAKVIVKHKPSNTVEVSTVDIHMGRPRVITTWMGQVSPSTSTNDYEVLSIWRPIPGGVGVYDFGSSFHFAMSVSDVFSSSNWWANHPEFGMAIRFRHVDGGTLPDTLEIDTVTNPSDFYAMAPITQGVLKRIVIGSTNGEPWQHIPIASAPIEEPIEDPKIRVVVGNDSDWFVVDDFSASGPTSKHVIFREDSDQGWGIVFGDGSVGRLPNGGQSVVVEYRTGSEQPGDIEAISSITALNASGVTRDFVLPRPTSGWQSPEASSRESAVAFRNSVIPQLALRSESVVTPKEIVAALTGGAPGRATFETIDGRRPFSRGRYSLDGVGSRQYRVVVVGDRNDINGSVSAPDLTEAEKWLNGEEIGIEIVGGHGPQNTEAVVQSFIAVPMKPVVNVVISEVSGVRRQVESVIRRFFQPHSTDDQGAYRFNFGNNIPVAILFGLLWDALPGRVLITVTVDDGTTTHSLGDSIPLSGFELPILDPSFNPEIDITVSTP